MDWTRYAALTQRSIIGPLGEPVVIGAGAQEVTVRGIYQRPPVETENDGGVDYHGLAHRVTVRLIDLPSWADRATHVTVRGAELRIVERVPDGQGLISLDCRAVQSGAEP